MKKKSLFTTILLLLIAVFAFSLTACNNEVGTLETLKNEYGIVVDGGSFEEGSTLVSNEIVATTEEAAKVLAANTNYATMISAPTCNRNKLKFIQLSQLDNNQIIAVIVMEGNIIKNKIVTVEETLNNEIMLKLNMLYSSEIFCAARRTPSFPLSYVSPP